MNRKIVEIDFPDYLFMRKIDEVDMLPWLNEMLEKGYVFCGLMPSGNGSFRCALFITEEKPNE